MSEAGIVIRRARPEDGERVAAMVLALARHEGKSSSQMTGEAFRRSGFGRRARFSTLVAEAGGGLQGYAIFMPVFSVAEAKPGCYLDDLYVEPDWRSRNLGRLLMQRLARDCVKRGAHYIMWNVRLGNAGAVAFYDRIGAVKTDLNCRWVHGAAFDRLAGTPPPQPAPA